MNNILMIILGACLLIWPLTHILERKEYKKMRRNRKELFYKNLGVKYNEEELNKDYTTDDSLKIILGTLVLVLVIFIFV